MTRIAYIIISLLLGFGASAQSLQYSVPQFLDFSKSKQESILDSFSTKYNMLYSYGQFEECNIYASKARELGLAISDKKYVPESLVFKSRYYSRVTKSDSSIVILKKVEQDYPEYFFEDGDFHYKTLGMFYNHLNKLDSALYYTLKADSMANLNPMDQKFDIKLQMSDLYQKMGRNKESVDIAVTIMNEMSNSLDTVSQIYVLYMVANIAYENNRLDVYSEAAKKYLEISKNRKSSFHQGIFDLDVPLLKYIADLESIQATYAQSNYRRGYEHATEKLMFLYVRAKRYKKAYAIMVALEESILADNFENSSIQFLQAKLETEKALGLDKSALVTADMLISYKDSIQKSSLIQTSMELEKKYNTRQKEQEIKLLNTENELQKMNLQRSNFIKWILGLGTLVLAIFSFFLIQNIRNKKILNAQLSEKNVIIASNLSEKETLLKEIHHRVKNNLQIVSSLLRLQSRSITDNQTKEILQEGQNRVQSMALIHQNLYKTDDLTGLEFKDYLEKLCENLLSTYKLTTSEVQLDLDIQPINLDVSTLIPLGLIINEIFTNSLKYAFDKSGKKTLGVSLHEKEDELELIIKDNGVGATQDLIDYLNKPNAGRNSHWGFGTRLIKTFAQKLNADIEADNINGTSILLKIRNYQTV